MATSPSAIRQAVRDALATVDGLRESPWLSDAPMRDPQSVLDGAFSVTVPRTQPVETRRFRSADDIRCRTTVMVRCVVTTRQDDPLADYDDALDREATILATVAVAVVEGCTAPALQSCDRTPIGDDTAVLLTSEWTVDHALTLTQD